MVLVTGLVSPGSTEWKHACLSLYAGSLLPTHHSRSTASSVSHHRRLCWAIGPGLVAVMTHVARLCWAVCLAIRLEGSTVILSLVSPCARAGYQVMPTHIACSFSRHLHTASNPAAFRVYSASAQAAQHKWPGSRAAQLRLSFFRDRHLARLFYAVLGRAYLFHLQTPRRRPRGGRVGTSDGASLALSTPPSYLPGTIVDVRSSECEDTPRGRGGRGGGSEGSICCRPVRIWVVAMAPGSAMLCCPRRGAGPLGRLGTAR